MQKEQPHTQHSSQAIAETPKTLLLQQRQYQQAINANGHERLTAAQKNSLVFYALENTDPDVVPMHPLKQQLLSALMATYQQDVMPFDDTVHMLKNQVVHNTKYVQLLMLQPEFDKQEANHVLNISAELIELCRLFNTFVHYDLDIFSTGLFTK